jgi:hypothetical protein
MIAFSRSTIGLGSTGHSTRPQPAFQLIESARDWTARKLPVVHLGEGSLRL